MHENLPLDSRRTFEKKLLEKFFLQTGPFPLLFSENSLRFSYLVIYVIKIRYLFFSGMLFVNYNLFFRLSLIANFCKNHGWQMQETPMTNFCKKVVSVLHDAILSFVKQWYLFVIRYPKNFYSLYTKRFSLPLIISKSFNFLLFSNMV